MRVLTVVLLVAMTVGCAATVPVQQRSASLGETQRRYIYLELVRTEDRADAEAEAMYPFDAGKIPARQLRTYDFRTALKQNSAESDRRRLAYREKLRGRFGITEGQLRSIADEGLVNRWPMPE